MNGSIIDTNVIIRMLNNDKTAINLLMREEKAYVPIIVFGELLYGAQKSSRPQQNAELFIKVIAEYELVNIDDAVAKSYAGIKAALVKKGINIPENDLWIAATAQAHNLPLVTFDAHFGHIDGIEIISE